jgi:hypothetical protein
MKLKKNQNSIKGSRTKIRNKKEHGPGLKIKQIGGGGPENLDGRAQKIKRREKKKKKKKKKRVTSIKPEVQSGHALIRNKEDAEKI